MSRMHYLRTAKNGEPSTWWSWQDLRGGVERKGPPPKGLCTHGRAWLKWEGNGVGAEWHLFTRCCHLGLTFSSTGDDAIMLSLAIPFLFALYLSVERAKWIKRLPGVRWVSGDYNSGERELRVAVHDNALWWNIWINGMGMRNSSWRDSCFHFDDFFLGRSKYSESPHQYYTAAIEMPEGYYIAKIELFTSTWKRPRWPFPQSIARADVEIEGGVPVPGDGENSWDMDDDCILSGMYPAATVEEALAAVRESAMRTRRRNGGENWVPADGWPAHCELREHGNISNRSV